CAHEIGVYARAAQQGAVSDMQFCPLSDAASFGLDSDAAAKQLHVIQGGKLVAGVDAFIAIWAALPSWVWAARLASLPVIRPALGFVYTRIAAPMLYQSHLRRQRKALGK
ncbi:MAG: thiol-disulfide oxidoreductase DCC family protein, partial [Cypionkella sp.]